MAVDGWEANPLHSKRTVGRRPLAWLRLPCWGCCAVWGVDLLPCLEHLLTGLRSPAGAVAFVRFLCHFGHAFALPGSGPRMAGRCADGTFGEHYLFVGASSGGDRRLFCWVGNGCATGPPAAAGPSERAAIERAREPRGFKLVLLTPACSPRFLSACSPRLWPQRVRLRDYVIGPIAILPGTCCSAPSRRAPGDVASASGMASRERGFANTLGARILG